MTVRDLRPNWPGIKAYDPRPLIGDLVIALLDGAPMAYGISVVPHVFQFACNSYDEALEHAREIAVVGRVDVWVAEDAHCYALVSRHRADFPRPPRY